MQVRSSGHCCRQTRHHPPAIRKRGDRSPDHPAGWDSTRHRWGCCGAVVPFDGAGSALSAAGGVPNGRGACRDCGVAAFGAVPGLGASAEGWPGSPKGSGACWVGAAGVAARSRSCKALELPPLGTSESTRERSRKMPPHHQVSFVRIVTACRFPSTVSVPPPPNEASPPPWPAWSSTTTERRSASSARRVTRKANMVGDCNRKLTRSRESLVASRQAASGEFGVLDLDTRIGQTLELWVRYERTSPFNILPTPRQSLSSTVH